MRTVKNFISKLLLLAIAIFLLRYIIFWEWITLPLLALSLVKSFWQRHIGAAFDVIGAWLYAISLAIDMLGNVLLAFPLNLFFVQKGGYLYGKAGETISSATGKNVRDNTLTKGGRVFAQILDFGFGKNHCVESIQENV